MQYHRLPDQNSEASFIKDVLFLLLVLGALFFILLGSRPLYVPDEGRYAEIVREMANFGDYVTPYVNHIKYFEKPVFFYWLGTAAVKVAGLSLWTLRSINALLGLFGCLLTYYTARKLYNRATGLWASIILGTSLLYFVMSHMISLDLPITVFLAVSLYAFLLGWQQPVERKRKHYLYLSASAAAISVLTKGLIGIVFPIIIICTWITLIGAWGQLKRLHLPMCIALFLLISLPWHILVAIKNPEFFHYYFIVQHFQRYTDTQVGHYQPSWFFLPYLFIGLFPWSFFLPQAVTKLLPPAWRTRKEHSVDSFFLIWTVVIFVFFSFSKSKLIPYILPIFPPLAILIARYFDIAIKSKFSAGIKFGFAAITAFSLVVAFGCYKLVHDIELPNANMAAACLYSAAFVLLAGAVTCSYFVIRRAPTAIMAMAATIWLFLLLLLAALPSIDRGNIASLAAIIKPVIKPEDEVVAFNQYYHDLPFYLERRITVLNWKNELSYGMEYQNTKEWMINNETFWQRWHSKNRVFVLMGTGEFEHIQKKYPQESYHLLGYTTNNVLISNQK